MRVASVLAAAPVVTGLVLRPGPPKGAWIEKCDELAGIVTPYYVPGENEMTLVGCVPSTCREKVGRTTDVEVGAEPKCTWENMADMCCTDNIPKATACAGGSLPCYFGEVSSLEDYTTAAVAQAKAEDAQAVMKDCSDDGEAGGAGPEKEFVDKVDAATAR